MAGNRAWDEYVSHAKEFIDTGNLEYYENDYKCKIARKVAAAREAALTGADDWADLVKKGLAPSNSKRSFNNLIYPIQWVKFRDWVDEFPDDALKALEAIWTGRANSPVVHRVRSSCDRVSPSGVTRPGNLMRIASVLLMGVDVEQYPPFKITFFKETYQRVGYRPTRANADEAALYEHALGFLDRFIEEAQARGIHLRHRLDAQSVAWQLWKFRKTGTWHGWCMDAPGP